jgi:hypothetical protein
MTKTSMPPFLKVVGFLILLIFAVFLIYYNKADKSQKNVKDVSNSQYPLIEKEGDELTVKTAEEIEEELSKKRSEKHKQDEAKIKPDCYVDYRKIFTKIDMQVIDYFNPDDLNDIHGGFRVWRITFSDGTHTKIPANRNVYETKTIVEEREGEQKILMHVICDNNGIKFHYYKLQADKKTLDKMTNMEYDF